MQLHVRNALTRTLVLAGLALAPVAVLAQDAPKAAAPATPSADSPSRWDIFAGYSYLAPKGTVNTVAPDGSIIPANYHAIDTGAIVSVARYFNKYVGAEGIGDVHFQDESKAPSDDFSGGSAGLIFRFPTEEITPFAHGLVGIERAGGPMFQRDVWGPVLTVGGGMDYATPLFNHRLAIRLFQADYQWSHENWGSTLGQWGGRGNPKMARLSAGVVFHVGTIAPPPQLAVSCSANPTSVFPGDPVNLTATVSNQEPKLGVVYNWSGDGVTGNGANATVNTANLAPGTHTVKCEAKEGKPGKEGVKPWQVANEGTATFTVKEFEPPTISCSANPTTLKPGDSATITATAMSPQNRPLTYTYSASSGAVNGTGNTATFSSTGAPTGPVSITCNVADDKGHNASSNTSVTIEAPPPPPQPHAQALCSINFTTDKRRPTRVDNEAKACLDEVALDLQKQSDAKAVVVGESNAKEKAAQEKAEKLAARRKHAKPVISPAAQRAINAKEYLVTDKGIDPSRITVATGTGDDQKVENYLVPAGANFSSDVSGTTPVDESTVKPQVRKALPQRHHGHKKAAK